MKEQYKGFAVVIESERGHFFALDGNAKWFSLLKRPAQKYRAELAKHLDCVCRVVPVMMTIEIIEDSPSDRSSRSAQT
jgi:hypothetical protein